jgi:hypothetical protein
VEQKMIDDAGLSVPEALYFFAISRTEAARLCDT